MARIAGVNIPTNKRVLIALQYIHGIGPASAKEITEKVVVETTIVNIRSGLRFRIAELLLAGAGGQQATLAGSNPINYAERPPPGYLGELRKPGKLPPGSWYYEQDRAELVYIPILTANLTLDGRPAGDDAGLRWQIAKISGEAGVVEVDIRLLTPYRWF